MWPVCLACCAGRLCITPHPASPASFFKMSKRKERPLLEKVADDGNSKFARALASVDFHTRERGLQALTLWLSRRPDVGELELLKLWKGIFYCFWHSDKAPVQVTMMHAYLFLICDACLCHACKT